MQKYKFQFEAIIKIKEILEKKAQKEVAIIDMEIEKLKKDILKLEEDRRIFLKNENDSYKASELQFQHDYHELLDLKIKNIQIDIDDLNIKREEKLKELVQKSKEHKIFNTLEENYRANFNQEQNKLESGEIDEIAISKFIRKDK